MSVATITDHVTHYEEANFIVDVHVFQLFHPSELLKPFLDGSVQISQICLPTMFEMLSPHCRYESITDCLRGIFFFSSAMLYS